MRKFFLIFIIVIFLGGVGTPVFAYRPADDFYGKQWYLRQIKIQQAWDFTRGSGEVVVAVLDSGVDLDHPDLARNIWINKGEIAGDGRDNDGNGYIDDRWGWDFIDNDNDPQPEPAVLKATSAGINHGTIIAGILGAVGNNGEGIAGVNWQVKIMPLRVLDSEGSGNTVAAVAAIDYALVEGVDIINMSFVGEGYSKAMYEAIERAWNKGVIIVGATGNDSVEGGEDLDKNPNYPAAYDGTRNMVIGVTALDRSDKKAVFANYGVNFVDIAAPGIEYFSTLFYDTGSDEFSKYYGGYWSGSSVATALVSGVASLIKSLNPSLSNEKIRDAILETADNINNKNPKYSGKLGKGRLNAYKAMDGVYKGYFNTQASKDILAGAGRGRKPEVKILDSQGILKNSFLAYAPGFRGGVKVVGCDLDNDNIDEIITAPGVGGGPHIRIFNKEGEVKGQFFAYDKMFRGGVNVACGDVNGDGKNEIVAGAGPGGGPHVRVFDKEGNLVSQFFAYSDKFRGGVNVAAHDLNKDGKAEIITGPSSRGGPHVRIFDFSGNFINHFFAFSSDFRGGVDVSVGDLDGDNMDEIVVAVTTASVPYVRVFDIDLKLKYQFRAYDDGFRGGVRLMVADLESDGVGEILVGPASFGDSELLVYDITGKKLLGFSVFEKGFGGGVDVGVVSSN